MNIFFQFNSIKINKIEFNFIKNNNITSYT